ncbi:MAG: FAD-dependent oxidoreductase, partial [Gemmatimonadetes bacterium]|nr:FAD-dependent oxidoreductase [Gemmatimonadota bacterium]
MHSLPEAPLRVAVVGAGVSGLVAARALSRRHQITVFEADARVGGHAHTVDVEDPLGRVPVDTGFIVYNERTYPAFSRLLRELDVETRATTMSFSVRCDVTNLEYNGDSFRTLFAQRRNLVRPRFWRLLRDVHRFYRHGEAQVGAAAPDTTVAEFVARHGYGREFVDQHLLPLGAAIWSSPPGTFARFPVRFVVDFLARHDLLELDLAKRVVWRTVVGGSRAYVDRLVAPFRDRIRTSCPVRTIERDELGVTLRLPGGAEERFDHVVLACHSDQALRLL